MASATVTSKGQVTIPQKLRRKLELEAGDRIEFVELPDGAYAVQPALHDVRTLSGLLRHPNKPVSVEAMNAAIRSRRAKR